MSKTLLLMICILTGLLVLACAKSAETNRNLAPATSSTPVPAGTPATTASTGDKIGVAECDNFITAYETCVSSKVPEAGRAAMRSSLATLRAEWKKAADNPQTRPTLAAACKSHLEATRTQMKAYGCTF
jgi:hypothetical protein